MSDVFRECSCDSHGSGGSSYPRRKVPIKLFRKEPDNPKSILYKSCANCRVYINGRNTKSYKIRLAIAIENGNKQCCRCRKEMDKTEQSTNEDGTLGTLCIPCKIKSKQDRVELAN